jgi:hypothetical protein
VTFLIFCSYILLLHLNRGLEVIVQYPKSSDQCLVQNLSSLLDFEPTQVTGGDGVHISVGSYEPAVMLFPQNPKIG